MHHIRLALLLLSLLLIGGQAFAQGNLRIATEGAYPPFNNMDENGNIVGFDVDIARALCKDMGATCKIITNEWDTILDGLVDNKYDAVVSSMALTDERLRKADFTDYYYRSRSTFVGDPNLVFVQTREGVRGLILGTQAGTVQARYLEDNFMGSATIRTGNTTKDVFEMLTKGEIDAMLTDSLAIYEFLQTEAGRPFDFLGDPLPAQNPSSEARIAVRKGEKALVKSFNQAIRNIRLNGVYDKINRKYFPFSIY